MAKNDEGYSNRIKATARENVLSGSGLQINAPISLINQVVGGAESKEALCLRDLYITNPWLDKQRIEDAKGGLLLDSYNWILKHAAFRQWREAEGSGLLWVKGSPGTGKTMLLCGVVDKLGPEIKRQQDLLSFFFCEAGNNNADSAAAVLRGLIYLLVSNRSGLIKHVVEEHKNVGSKLFEGPGAWYTLLEIYLRILPDLKDVTTYIAIDALDECGEDLERLLSMIAKASEVSAAAGTRIKWLVTSSRRADVARRLGIGKAGRLGLDLDECAEDLKGAVDAYIAHYATKLAANTGLRQEIEAGLQEKAGATFQYVTLAVAQLRAVTPHELRDVLREAAPDMEGLYKQASNRIDHLEPEIRYLCRNVLATVAIAHRPLGREELCALSGLPPDRADSILLRCESFAIQGRTTFSANPSAREFLRADRVLFPGGLESEHRRVFLRSLDLMKATLRRDMYSLGRPGFLAVEIKVPDPNPLAAAGYACEYWIEHLVASRYHGRDARDNGALANLLESKYLYWIESLSLLKGMRTVLSSWTKLVDFFKGEKQVRRLADLVADAQRFLEYNGQCIMERPLQTYASAVVFVPSDSKAAELVHSEEPDWVNIGEGMREEHWSPWVQTLDPRAAKLEVVGPVAFSPDGAWLAAPLEGHGDGKTQRVVQVWDVVMGNSVWTLQDVGRWVGFPPNSSLLATAAGPSSSSGELRFWDLGKGAWHQRAINPLSFSAAAFSPDGVWLAAADGKHITVWDWARGDCALRFGHGSASPARSVAYSADGAWLASAHQGEIRICNANSGSQLRCVGSIEASLVAFSPNESGGGRLISASNESLVSWSAETGERLGMLDVLSKHDAYGAVALSADGRLFAAAPDDSIAVWDAAPRRRLQTLQGYDRHVRSLVFSPDCRQLASVGARGLRLYRAASSTNGDVLRAARDHPDRVGLLRVSAGGCGATMVSASATTIKIWDLAFGGRGPREIELADGGILDVALSPDGARLVTVCSREMARIWDASTGECLQTLPDYGAAAAFSPDGGLVAMVQSSGTLKVWSLAKKRYTIMYEQRTAAPAGCGGLGLGSVTFAPDGRIATSFGRSIRLWKTTRVQWVKALEDDATAKSLVFSSDGSRLAASYDDGRIKIWDLTADCCLQTLDSGGSRRVNVISLDATGSRLLTDVGLVLCGLDQPPAVTGARTETSTGTGAGNGGPKIRRQGYGVDVDAGWITWDSEKALWLPPAYRPDSTVMVLSGPEALTPSMIALGCHSGRVVVLRFPTQAAKSKHN